MPVLSMGGMRFQQSWKDLDMQEILFEKQKQLESILSISVSCGMNHIETARHYGSSELQIGEALKVVPDPYRIIQTKVPPSKDPKKFEAELEISFEKLQLKKIDLLAIHGINLPEHLEQTIRKGGCLDVVRRWQRDGKIAHVGFSTHGPTPLIIKAIETGEFDYVNLHWYFIRQENSIALDAARKFDLGVFIISPTDKGGHLHTPSEKLLKLCEPIHPIVFNDLFCLEDERIHTISIGLSKVEDFKFHLEAIQLLETSDQLLLSIQKRLIEAAHLSLGGSWMKTWDKGLPSWEKTPGQINLPILLWLHNLVEAWEMNDYAAARYGLLGSGGHWFPGANADCLDQEVSEDLLKDALINSPWQRDIPQILRNLRKKLGGESLNRLSQT
tara:strand:- start:13742 stop:14899 length:1158 start_codon:yes stop_codon:yes gene_type:complete